MTGSVPAYIEAILNSNAAQIKSDNLIYQLYQNGFIILIIHLFRITYNTFNCHYLVFIVVCFPTSSIFKKLQVYFKTVDS